MYSQKIFIVILLIQASSFSKGFIPYNERENFNYNSNKFLNRKDLEDFNNNAYDIFFKKTFSEEDINNSEEIYDSVFVKESKKLGFDISMEQCCCSPYLYDTKCSREKIMEYLIKSLVVRCKKYVQKKADEATFLDIRSRDNIVFCIDQSIRSELSILFGVDINPDYNIRISERSAIKNGGFESFIFTYPGVQINSIEAKLDIMLAKQFEFSRNPRLRAIS